MNHRIRPFFVLLILTSYLVGCGGATETPPPTAKPVQPTPTGNPVEFTTTTPSPPTDTPAPTPTPKPKPPTATKTPTSAPPTDTPTAAPPPQPAALKGVIVFPVFDAEAGTYNVYSAKPDGSDRKLVTAEASQPALNSDGKRIAYRSWQPDNRGLIERGLEDGDTWRFDSFFEAARPNFSPDDQTILFQSREGGEEFAIYHTVESEYMVLRREAFPVQGEAPVWTADGESIVYKGCWGDHCGLYMIKLDGSLPQQIADDLSDTNPAISPDGKSIAFMSQSEGNWDVYIMELNGTGRRQLTTDPASDGLPTWAPDGKTIAFVSERGGEWAIWAMKPDGSNQRQLFELGGSLDGVVTIDAINSNGWLEESIDWAP